MRGFEKNLARLFANRGKLLLVALDHPQFFGPLKGLEDPRKAIEDFNVPAVDGFVLNPGITRFIEVGIACEKKLVVRVNIGGNKFSTEPMRCPVVLSPKSALELGADAVILMFTIGSEEDITNTEEVARAIEDFHLVALPVFVEILPNPSSSKDSLTDLVETGARIAAELGADIIKVPYTPEFKRVVSGCPVPVVLAGGPKDANVLSLAKAAVRAGARGFVIGRNVFQAERPLEIISRLEQILRG